MGCHDFKNVPNFVDKWSNETKWSLATKTIRTNRLTMTIYREPRVDCYIYGIATTDNPPFQLNR